MKQASCRRIQTFCCHFDKVQKQAKFKKIVMLKYDACNSKRIKSTERITIK